MERRLILADTIATDDDPRGALEAAAGNAMLNFQATAAIRAPFARAKLL